MTEIDVNGVTFYASYYKAIMRIPDNALRLKAFEVITTYMMTGECPEELDWRLASIFDAARPNMDASRDVTLRGQKGGRPKTTENRGFKPNQKEVINQVEVEEKEKERVEEKVEKENVKEKSSSPRSATDARFDIFWQTYPRKTGKKDAHSVWKRLKITGEKFTEIIKAVETQKQSYQWQKDNGQYIPNPATWLRQGRWDDELPEARGAPSSQLDRVIDKWEDKAKEDSA